MIDKDDELLAAVRARALNPSTRIDVGMSPSLRAPATLQMISAEEERLGCSLPPLLRRIYSEIANGGFGPGYGLLCVGGDGIDEPTVATVYAEFRQHQWPIGVLPLWDWGDAIWSCVDTRGKEGVIITHDDVDGSTGTAFVIRSWLQSWVDGVDLWKEMYEENVAMIVNPFTKKPVPTKVRGAAKGKPQS